MAYAPTEFEVTTSKGLGGDIFTRNVTDGRMHAQMLLHLDSCWVLTVLEKVAKKDIGYFLI